MPNAGDFGFSIDGQLPSTEPPPDFRLADHGSVCVLTPLSEAAKEWATEHLPSDAPSWCGGTVIEPRHLGPVLEGIAADGLEVES